MTERACDGGQTRSIRFGEMEECEACLTCVAWDLTDHPFWGFKATCRKPITDASGRIVAPPQPVLPIRPDGPWDGNTKGRL